MSFLYPLAVITAAILWSFDGFLRQSLYSVPSLLIVGLEHGFGTLLFFPVLWWMRKVLKNLSRKEWMAILYVSLLGGIAGTFLYTKALSYVDYIDLSVVVMLQKLQPIFGILCSWIFLRERLHKHFLLLAGAAIIGGYIVTFGFAAPQQTTHFTGTMIAALCAIGAAFAWGSSTSVGKYALQKQSVFLITALRLFVTSLFALTLLAATQGLTEALHLEPMQWAMLLAIVFSTGSVALCLYYFGLKRVPASHSSLYELAWPLSAVIIDWAVRGHTLSPAQIFGAILLLASITLLVRTSETKAV